MMWKNLNRKWIKTDWQMENWEMKKLWDKKWRHWCVTKVPSTMLQTESEKIALDGTCTRDTFQKIFWKIEYFSGTLIEILE